MNEQERPDSIPSEVRLHELLNYDPETGALTWKVSNAPRRVGGRKAGYVDGNGYVMVGIDGKKYCAHRLIFMMMTGSAPVQIDHKDRVRHNNAWTNLRAATRSQNSANQKPRTDNKTGFRGVVYCDGKYVARIGPGSSPIRLGSFNTPEEAHAAYCAAADRLYGEFASHDLASASLAGEEA
jgi:hypothetical protein